MSPRYYRQTDGQSELYSSCTLVSIIYYQKIYLFYFLNNIRERHIYIFYVAWSITDRQADKMSWKKYWTARFFVMGNLDKKISFLSWKEAEKSSLWYHDRYTDIHNTHIQVLLFRDKNFTLTQKFFTDFCLQFFP